STLACAVSSTELSGTASSFESRCNAATSSSGILTSCSPTPATGSRVHRGSAVNPPASSTPRQNSRPRSAVVNVLRGLRLPISHLLPVRRSLFGVWRSACLVGTGRTPIAKRRAPFSHLLCWVPPPPCVCRDLLAL